MKKSIAHSKLNEVVDEVFIENQKDKDIHDHCFYSKLFLFKTLFMKNMRDKARKEATRRRTLFTDT